MGDESAGIDAYPLRDAAKEVEEAENKKTYSELNGLALLLFIFPALFEALVAIPFGRILDLFFSFVHEGGHFFGCLLGDGLFCMASGTIYQLSFCIVLSLIFLRHKETYSMAFGFLMCLGLSISHTGIYMQSAMDPSGVIGMDLKPITSASHDWTNIYNNLGIPLSSALPTGLTLEYIGNAISLIFFCSTLAAFVLFFVREKRKLPAYLNGPFSIISPIAAADAAYVIISGGAQATLWTAFALAIPQAIIIAWHVLSGRNEGVVPPKAPMAERVDNRET